MNINQEWRWLKHKLGIFAAGIKDPRGSFTGMLSYDEGLTLARLAGKIPKGGVIVEIGCYGGLSTAYLLDGARKRDGRLYSIDPFDTAIEEQLKDRTNVNLTDRKPSLEQVREKLNEFGGTNFVLIRGFSYDVVKEWNRPIDLLWIDGNHDHLAVRRDLEQWTPFLRQGGIIAMHDSNKKDDAPGWTPNGWDGPTRAAREVLIPPRWSRIIKIDSITHATKAGVTP